MIDYENILIKLKEDFPEHTFEYLDNKVRVDGKHEVEINYDSDGLKILEESQDVDAEGFIYREISLQIQNKIKE